VRGEFWRSTLTCGRYVATRKHEGAGLSVRPVHATGTRGWANSAAAHRTLRGPGFTSRLVARGQGVGSTGLLVRLTAGVGKFDGCTGDFSREGG
jgi:hypothetical protein